MFHIRLMLRQMLTTERLPNVKEWEETLLKLAMQIARDLVLTTGRREVDMDVRRFVKIKRIPGGSPKDSEYVDGAVITKNFAHKRMSRQFVNPRIICVTFPFDYNRVEGQIIAFDPLVAQEEEYMKNLVSRVAALRPHILLVEKTVTRRALDYLHQANIAVARNVKVSAIQNVARMTQGDIISSMDRLAIDPKLGQCGQFKIQTFEHPLIPGKRKTYMRFEGCNRDLGCTILLRGGDISTLTKVKKVTRFLAFLVRNLKMETFLWKDSVVTMPPLSRYAVPTPPVAQFANIPAYSNGAITPLFGGNLMAHLSLPLATIESMNSLENEDEESLPEEDALALRLSRRIQKSIQPYYTTFISVSATLRFPPPYPILQMKQLDDRLRDIKRAWEDEVIRREESAIGSRHRQEATVTLGPPPLPPAEFSISPMSTPSLVEEAPSYFEHGIGISPAPTKSSFGSLDHSFDHSVDPSFTSFAGDANPVNLKKVSDIALESELAMVRHEHVQAQGVWEWYLRRNEDDFVVEKYQRIAYRTYTVPFADVDVQMPCFMPQLNYVSYYGNNDCTLGNFIEESCVKYLSMKPGTLCTGKGCGKPQVGHCNVFVHNQTRLLIATEPWEGTIAGHEQTSGIPADYLTTWSVCRLCGKFTPFIPVSLETQQYSFAKFLELHFYPADVMLMQGAGCMHNIYQHHVRYFAWKGLTVRFQSDPIVTFEPVFPAAKVFIRPDVPLQLKNYDYEHLLNRNAKFWQSVEARLRWYDTSLSTTGMNEKYGIDEDALSSVPQALLTRAEAAKLRITQAIHSAYSSTFITDTLAFGKIRQELQDESTLWEKEFEKLDDMRRPPPPTFFEKELRRSVAIPSRFKGMFGGAAVPGTNGSEPNEKVRRPSMTETEPEGTDGDTIPRNRDNIGPRTTSETTEDSASKGSQGGGEESDSTINATQVASRQPSLADLRTVEEEDTKEPTPKDSLLETAEVLSPVDIIVKLEAATHPPSNTDKAVVSTASTSVPRVSRLPRRVKHSPRIAHLVQHFQTPGSESLQTLRSQSPVMSESEQEVEVTAPIRSSRAKNRIQQISQKEEGPLSDFEGSYAANVAPLYFAHQRPSGYISRIPAPVVSGSEGLSSRKASPERPAPGLTIRFGQGFRSFEAPKTPTIPMSNPFTSKGKEKMRSNLSLTANTPYRRASTLGPNKVTKITKHYENLARETEKNRRATSLRHRKARPVATARVTVEVLKTVKEGFQDASESSSSSSEADDEDEDEDPLPRPKRVVDTPPHNMAEGGPQPPPIDLASSTEDVSKSEATEPDMKTLLEQEEVKPTSIEHENSSGTKERSGPPSPFLAPVEGLERTATMPILSESEMSQPERSSVMRALSMFQTWAARPVDRGPDVQYPG